MVKRVTVAKIVKVALHNVQFGASGVVAMWSCHRNLFEPGPRMKWICAIGLVRLLPMCGVQSLVMFCTVQSLAVSAISDVVFATPNWSFCYQILRMK